MSSSVIKRYIIRGLFDYQTVDIPFESNVKIFIGENGLGKTTVLNSLYYLLTQDFAKLHKISFSSIEIHFAKKKILFSKEDLDRHIENSKVRPKSSFYFHLHKKLAKIDLDELNKIITSKNDDRDKRFDVNNYLKKKDIHISAPLNYLYENIERIIYEKRSKVDFNEIIEILTNEITSKILYFPTYRRIEEDLKNLSNLTDRRETKYNIIDDLDFPESEDEEIEKGIIQFGMGDVEERIRDVTSQISRSSIIGFSKVTGDMLNQLLRGFPDLGNGRKSIKVDTIKVILNRVGPNLSQDDKANIIGLIETNKIFDPENKQLVYFLEKLLEVYQSQEILDTAIKNFRDVCNGYLKGKHYEYDESTVSLKIVRDNTINEEVELFKLSSGEKQIVSLFAKIYLELDKNIFVLFDEPELSLSVFWQKKLLPDIISSGKCNFLLAVTHSPFIFENSLRDNTIGLKEFIIANEGN